MKLYRNFHCIFFTLILSSVIFSCNKDEMKPVLYNGNYNRDFNDLNDLHLESAKKLGINPINSREEVNTTEKKLKKVESLNTYIVEDLTHSIPYLIPEALDLLDKIGTNFNDSLKNFNYPDYKLIVTSLTRTKNDIKNLRKRNGNSSENSAHMYATTFDISWKRFEKCNRKKVEESPEKLKRVLASVLRDLKKEQACYVKHEKRQGCFHITVR